MGVLLGIFLSAVTVAVILEEQNAEGSSSEPSKSTDGL